MHMKPNLIIGLLLALWLPWFALAVPHHDIEVHLDLKNAAIDVRDTIKLSQDHSSSLMFTLHPALQVKLLSDSAKLTEISQQSDIDDLDSQQANTIIPRRYRVDFIGATRQFTLRYQGNIAHALQSHGEEYARSFEQTPGLVSPTGVFLSGSSAWYPQIDGGLLSFDLKLHLPDGWKSMSQGQLIEIGKRTVEHWRAMTPQEEIYLIAGPFTAYTSTENNITAMVLLREPDTTLAEKYLDHTHQYIDLYSTIIGPYPFTKFAMVENFWETGYGMPSFTLLGSRVIRLPFILYSSYPHEILHNWWGNNVYIDFSSGNWAEGLTSYLADHLIKEQRGSASAYRRDTLQKYADYVGKAEDFPLSHFRGRHSARTEAIGYGKTMMLFHMLRLQLGDDAFKRGLQAFYKQQRFQLADYVDLQSSFETVSDESMDTFFRQWVHRSGAPQLRISDARTEFDGQHYRLTALIEQTQTGPAYHLRVPVAVHLHGASQAYQTMVELADKRETVSLKLNARPLRVDVDPEFDVFRRLHRSEIPPAISQVMGAEQVLLVLPGEAPADLLEAYRALAKRWQTTRPGQVEIVSDNQIDALPANQAVWLFGWRNHFRQHLDASLDHYDFAVSDDGVRIADTLLTPKTHSLAVIGRRTDSPDLALGWLAADTAAAVSGLGRKLPHYGRYSYLGFTGTGPDNVLKGQWPVVDSPMSVHIRQADGVVLSSTPASLAPRLPLVAAEQLYSVERMRRDIEYLADSDLAGRGLGTTQLDRAADYIARQFELAGLQPGGNGESYFQSWQQQVEAPGDRITMKNVIAVLPGSDPNYAGQSVVVGAHYDHLGLGEHDARYESRGQVHPGADDNASGVAVMLELARSLNAKALPRSVVFAAFTAEETGLLGSRHYVAEAERYPIDKTIAMLNLDTVGRLGERPLILFGTGTAEEWVHIFRGAGYVTGVAVKTVADDFGSSDQTGFIEAGIPAVQFFSGQHEDFHRPGDTADKIDYAGLVKVAKVLNETLRYLGERPDRLQSTLTGKQTPARLGQPSSRRVSFGTVPDFSYSGEGVRLEDVRSATPAARAGLRPGDIIIRVNGEPVDGMRGYSEALKKLAPGDEIRVRYLRDGVQKTAATQVTAR
ncbi:MAG: M20/M25/M40 family metallo-hydrolase [Gammaproteobacteria bacterium]|nr:M20/M25/M40 family metallo-hydrolase [Gammaproteobacteria bacterium]